MYENAAELLYQAEQKRAPLWRIVLDNETELTGATAKQVEEKMLCSYRVMLCSAQTAVTDVKKVKGALIAGQAKALHRYHKNNEGLCGTLMQKAMQRALSCVEVNASMGKICAAPTAGACGILPAVVISICETFHEDEKQAVRALLTASGIGAVVMANATVSGAKGGCQAECGVAAAMAAGAAVFLRNGTNEQVLRAASLALICTLGLVCDPVGGYVQIPCAYRNVSQTASALACADMALAGIDARIPFDEAVQAMWEVGEMLPSALRETAKGGVAATPAAEELAKQIKKSFANIMEEPDGKENSFLR
ncbi:MAG: L-serine ammonia-lyase, iron-sulfur-dependent, subunit alpha [Christensenella sp.]|uniref:L-serine ammonia-lyase, iron-sulfur-dependent, subunit alpha n=1 Tax=Christensenella sp. TaxID=1935934 RepID=UPI002B1FA95E|nr:L-serine ammonia-lyase, iron-sulfur-dependent, subunit alpha [Christensenella sp.]MEA5003284.1 L-serine ammonia-lyase, iron-sulfur-dependent, subunit alpha [Christensenella sp.]